MTHNFDDSLAYSHSQSDAPYWEPVYRKAFPNLVTITDVRGDGWHQRAGIDRVLVMRNSTTIKVDEKVRRKSWPDIALEVRSDLDRGEPGWICKELACDYIAYAFEPTQTCYLLPFLLLQRAFEQNETQWRTLAQDSRGGFHVIDAPNEYMGRQWTTRSVAVPTQVLLDAIRDAIVIKWTNDLLHVERVA